MKNTSSVEGLEIAKRLSASGAHLDVTLKWENLSLYLASPARLASATSEGLTFELSNQGTLSVPWSDDCDCDPTGIPEPLSERGGIFNGFNSFLEIKYRNGMNLLISEKRNAR